jgi:hypothetical protein
LAARTQVCEHGFNAVLVVQSQGRAGNAQAHPTVLVLDPETTVLQVRQKPALGFVVGVGNVVSDHRAFTRYFADTCHVDTPIKQLEPLNNPETFRTAGFQPHLARKGWR